MTSIREREYLSVPALTGREISTQPGRRSPTSLSAIPEERLNQFTDEAKAAFPNNPIMQRLSIAIAIGKAGDATGIRNEFAKHNNLFGIQGEGSAGTFSVTAKATADGKEKTVNFASNNTVRDSFEQFRKRMELEKYKDVGSATDFASAATKLVEAGYVTNPDYAKKLMAIDEKVMSEKSQKSDVSSKQVSPPIAQNAKKQVSPTQPVGADKISKKNPSPKTRSDVSAAPNGKTIVLDPGHGDYTGDKYAPGNMATLNGVTYLESELNMALARDISVRLKDAGYNVVLTHEEVNFGENGKARTAPEYADIRTAYRGDYFVSIHNNSLPDSVKDRSRYSGTLVMADSAHSTVAAEYAKAFSRALGGHVPRQNNDRGISVLKPQRHSRPDGTERPSMLIEATYMTNDDDLMNVVDPEKRKVLADKIAMGIIKASSDPKLLAAMSKTKDGHEIAQARDNSNKNNPTTVASAVKLGVNQTIASAPRSKTPQQSVSSFPNRSTLRNQKPPSPAHPSIAQQKQNKPDKSPPPIQTAQSGEFSDFFIAP